MVVAEFELDGCGVDPISRTPQGDKPMTAPRWIQAYLGGARAANSNRGPKERKLLAVNEGTDFDFTRFPVGEGRIFQNRRAPFAEFA
jgi:hypothetical protein